MKSLLFEGQLIDLFIHFLFSNQSLNQSMNNNAWGPPSYVITIRLKPGSCLALVDTETLSGGALLYFMVKWLLLCYQSRLASGSRAVIMIQAAISRQEQQHCEQAMLKEKEQDTDGEVMRIQLLTWFE